MVKFRGKKNGELNRREKIREKIQHNWAEKKGMGPKKLRDKLKKRLRHRQSFSDFH